MIEKNKLGIIGLIGIIVVLLIFQTTNSFRLKSFEEKRKEVLSEIDLSIEQAKKEGKYKCCIEPACKMCFLGNWIWDDGTCDCDGMILNGEMDKVCPECVKGIKEGRCISATEEICEV
ncbi:MAG: hypothetical protein ISS48_03230 [Candidatus Aenigmarchaeota archaeon]|nr:hypothetical protein [Candidatus Aenigmarchaeota archaeon]